MSDEKRSLLRTVGDPLPIKLTNLDERFRRLLIFPEDLPNAITKAKQISGGKPVSSGLVQQAMLMLEYKTMSDLQADVERSKETFKLGDEYKKSELEYLQKNARSQDEYKFFSGSKKVNEFGIKRRLEELFIETIKFMQNNFSSEEVAKLCSSGSNAEKLFKSINAGVFNEGKVRIFRTLFSPEEQTSLFDNFPEIFIQFDLGPRYSNVSEETRNQLIKDFKEDSSRLKLIDGDRTYGKIRPLNLAALFSIGIDERKALLNNPFIENWLDDFDQSIRNRLDMLKKSTGDDFLYLLKNCNDVSLFSMDQFELRQRLNFLKVTFGDKFPWKKMYPEISDQRNLRATGISYYSVNTLNQVVNIYGKEVAERLFTSKVDVFDEHDNEQIPLISRLSGIEAIIGKDNFNQLLKNEEFYKFVDSIASYNKSHIEKHGRSILEQIKRAKEQFGENKLLLLLKNFAGEYFIRYSEGVPRILRPYSEKIKS